MREQLSGTASKSSIPKQTARKSSSSLADSTPDIHRHLGGWLSAPDVHREDRLRSKAFEEPSTKCNPQLRVLIVEGGVEMRAAFCEVAEGFGFSVDKIESAAGARLLLERTQIDILLLDVTESEGQNQALFEEMKTRYAETLVVVMSASGTIASAVKAMQSGAWDYLSKPFPLHILSESLQRAANRRYFNLERQRLQETLPAEIKIAEILGRSPEMDKLYRILSQVSHAKHPVVILGEDGTEKPLLAKSIHSNGPHAAKPFLSLDCKVLEPTLLESKLFGCVENTSDGGGQQQGLLASPFGGTLFLDEIGDMPLGLQGKLVKALKDKEVQPIGGTQAAPVSVRILAATNRDLMQMVRAGLFRMDLFQHLSVVNLRIPPLRGRTDDIAFLAQRYLERIHSTTGIKRTLSNETLRLLETYDWPDNVRELELSIASACWQTTGTELSANHFPKKLLDFHRKNGSEIAPPFSIDKRFGSSPTRGSIASIAEIEQRTIVEAIKQTNGDKRKAARLLGIGKTTIYRKLKEYGLADVDKSTRHMGSNPNSMLDESVIKSGSICA